MELYLKMAVACEVRRQRPGMSLEEAVAHVGSVPGLWEAIPALAKAPCGCTINEEVIRAAVPALVKTWSP